MFKYELGIRKVRPVLMLGGFLNYAFKADYKRHYTSTFQ